MRNLAKKMATSYSEPSTLDDATVCSICFEKFKTPRYLPCKHSFCHDCLSSYIVGQCKSTEPRLGFHCPLCRVYIPSKGVPGKPTEWAGLFPINGILQKIINRVHDQLCEPCLRDNDHEQASDYCLPCNEFLCKLCTKYHRKNMASLDHSVVSMGKIKSTEIVLEDEAANCPKHPNDKFQLYCFDHEQPCCALCGGTEHRKCEMVDTIENALNVLRKSGLMDSFLNKTKEFKKKLLLAKTKQEKNVSEIESNVDELVAKAEKDFFGERLDKMKRVYIDELFSTAKKGKEKLQRETEQFEDAILCVNHCETGIEEAKGSKDVTKAMIKFLTAKEKFHQIHLLELRQMYLKISAVESPTLKEFLELKSIGRVEVSEYSRPQSIDIRNIELMKYKEFTIDGENVFNGLFLPERRFLMIDYRRNGQCLMYDENWKFIHVNTHLSKPFDAIQFKDEIFVTDVGSKTIQVFSLADFRKLRCIGLHVHCEMYGITSFNEMLYIACGHKIVKIDTTGHILQNYNLDGRNTDHIIATESGLIVYSNWCLETVSAMSDEGQFVWEYKTPTLIYPQKLDTDSCENIYVAGTRSNNVHVLSRTGELIRLIENIQSPYFFKINEDEGIVCVCSQMNKIIVFQIISVVDTLRGKENASKRKII